MRQYLRQVDIGLARLERGLTVILFSLLIITIGANILARNLFHIASHQLLAAAPLLMLWVSLSGAIIALREQRHIKIELILRFLPKAHRRTAHVLTRLFGMLVTAVLSYAATIFVYQEIQLFGVWGGVAICFPLFFIAACIRLALQIVDPPVPDRSGAP